MWTLHLPELNPLEYYVGELLEVSHQVLSTTEDNFAELKETPQEIFLMHAGSDRQSCKSVFKASVVFVAKGGKF